VLDVEQVRVHGRLLLCVEVADDDVASLAGAVAPPGGLPEPLHDLAITLTPLADGPAEARTGRHLVTALAPELGAGPLEALFAAVAAAGSNIDRIVRLADYPVVSYELTVSGGDATALRQGLAQAAAGSALDVAVQPAGLHRRARHLVVLDADSTLLQGEVVDLLAARSPHADEVAAVTAAAMAGELDFNDALARRVALLAGLPVSVLDEVRAAVPLAPGARTLIRTLRRLGYATAVVSGGFVEVLGPLADELGIDHVAANRLEVAEGRLTGRLLGPVVDRPGKAAALRRFAEAEGLALAQTVAVGDGANDLDMLGAAGLGIAFNAKPLVRDAADAALNVPYLDAILFLLGIPRHEVEAADRDDQPVPAPG
jgi:phosphoserine phosphatase